MKHCRDRTIEANASKPNPFSGRTHSEESKRKIAQALRGNTNGIHRGNKGASHNGIRMDSMWEVAVAEHFDANGVLWQYAPDVFPLDERRSYRPDFRLGDGSYVEVKGYWRVENRKKFEDFKEKYPDVSIEVWEKAKLVDLGLLNKAGYRR